MRYFEDIEIGVVERFGDYAVTREEVIEFASKYDPQPFHLDDEAAAKTHFGRIAASGWHTCAMAMAMLVEHFRQHPRANLGGAGVDELRWLKPVHPGDRLRCEYQAVDKRRSETKPLGILRQRLSVFNQDNQPVLSFVSTSMVGLRPGGEASSHAG